MSLFRSCEVYVPAITPIKELLYEVTTLCPTTHRLCMLEVDDPCCLPSFVHHHIMTCPVAVSLTPLCAPPSPTRKAEQRPYAVLQRGFASVTPAHARSHFHAMRTAMAAM
jgi:hypothetical protein